MTDIIEAMASPNVDATAGTNAVVENAIACYSSGNIGSNYVQMIIFILIQYFEGVGDRQQNVQIMKFQLHKIRSV